MAFPVIEATNESAVTAAGTNHLVNLPAGIQANDLLVVVLAGGSVALPFNTLAGWTELLDENVAYGCHVWYRYATGATSDPTFVSTGSSRSAAISYRISGAANPATQPPEISAVATGTSDAPNPNTVTPTGGAKDYLWITFFANGSGEEADDDTWCNNAATNYGGLLQKTGGVGGTNVNAILAASSRTNNAASEDAVWPAASTNVSRSWRAFTLAVHPAPAAVAPVAPARLMLTTSRSQPTASSRLSPPTILGLDTPVEPVWWPPDIATALVRGRRKVGSFLTSLPLVTRVAPWRPIVAQLATTPRRYFQTRSKLRPPADVTAEVVAESPQRPLSVRFAQTSRRYFQTRAELRAPIVVDPVAPLAAPLRVRLAATPRRAYRAYSRLWPLPVLKLETQKIAAAFVQGRRKTGSFLAPPTIVTQRFPVASPEFTPVVDTSPVAPLRLTLATTPRQAYKAFSRLWPIPVLKLETQVIAKALVTGRRNVGSFLSPPTIVTQRFPVASPEETPPPPSTELAPPVEIRLVRSPRKQRPARFGASAPAVVFQAVTQRPVKIVTAVKQSRRYRQVLYRLRPPTSTTPATLVFPDRLDHTRATFTPDLDVTLLPGRLDHTRAIYAPQVNPTVVPERLDHVRAIYQPNLAGGTFLLPDRLDHTRTLYAPTVSPQLRPDRLDHTRTLYAPTVSPQLRPDRLDHTRTIYTPNVVVVVTPTRLDHTRAILTPTVSPQLRPERLDHDRAIYAPGIPAAPGPAGDDISTRMLPLQP